MDLNAPDNASSVTVADRIYEVVDGFIKDVNPEHLVQLIEHGYSEIVAVVKRGRKAKTTDDIQDETQVVNTPVVNSPIASQATENEVSGAVSTSEVAQ